jgi:endonuclease/exonuclease/phosphatase family metal-dependent hydrolase
VFLQEVQGKHKKSRLKKIISPEIPQTEFLAESHWPYYIYGKNAVYGAAHHGNALLSKFPFVDWDNINVALTQRASRSLLHGIITLSSMQIHVICIHLGLFKAERKIQLTLLSERIKEHIPDDAPLIIAGDFNDWQGLAENHLEMELGLKEVYKEFHGEHAKTFPTTRPTMRVDRIYYRGFGLKQTLVLSDEPWNKLSDHLPLYAKLTL